MTPNFGLPQRSIDELHAVFARHNKVHKVVIYGSRAMGNYKQGSDIDLTLFGEGLEHQDLLNISSDLDDSNIPYLVDLSIFDWLDHVKLRAHINREGKVFYDRCAAWKTVKLGDVCDFQSGLWKGKKEPFTSACVLRNTNFTASGELNYDNVAQLEVETNQLKKRILVKGDIILEKSGGGDKTPVGRVCLFNLDSNEPYSLSNFTARIRVLNTDEIAPKFLHRFLYFLYISGKTEPMQRHSTGIRNLQITQYKNIAFTYPPLAEQQRIVAKLDAAFAEIDTAIETTKNVFASTAVMHTKFVCQTFETLDAEFSRLEDVTKILNGFAFKSGDFITSTGANVVKITNVGIREFIETDDTQLPVEYANSYSKASVKQGDIVFALTRTIINGGLKVARVPDAYHGALLNQRVAAVSANPGFIDSSFLYLYLSSDIVKNYVIEHVNTLMQPNLSIADLKNLEIPVVSLEKQRLIAQKIESFALKSSEIQHSGKRKIKEYRALKSAILAQELQSETA